MALLDALRAVLFGTALDDIPRRRTAVFAGSTVVLLFLARNGGSTLAFGLALIAFAASAILWTRGQYTRYLSGNPAASGAYIYVLLLDLAAGMCSIYVVLWRGNKPVGGLLLAGLVLGYFAVGGLLTLWRGSGAGLGRWGLILGILAVVFSLMGISVLENVSAPHILFGVVVLAVGLLVFWPVAVALLSEKATSYFQGAPDASWRFGLVVGLGAATVVAAWTIVSSGSPPTALALLALAVLIVTVASSTRADIVLVVGILALMGFSPGDATPYVEPTDGDLLVALGDSYMSGEGASIFYAGTNTAGQDTCRRAPSAWAVQAGYLPPFDGTIFLACSGAVSKNVRTTTPPGSGLPAASAQAGEGDPQLRQYEKLAEAPGAHVTPALVVLSLGGNDAGFSTIGLMCLAPGNCQEEQKLWNDGLADVGRSLDETFGQVRAAFPGVPVVVTAYPDPIFRPVGGELEPSQQDAYEDCHQLALRSEERDFVAGFLDKLNHTVYTMATKHGFYFLSEMRDALRIAHLQLCDPENNGRPGVNFIGLRSVTGLAEQRFNPANWSHNSLHPNERGHQAMLQTFERWLAEHPDRVEDAPPEPELGARETKLPVADAGRLDAPLCSPLDPDPTGCRSKGTNWAAQQTVKSLYHLRGIQVILFALGWWLAVLSFFGWRRKRWGTTSKFHLV
jgi:lysophospholipase L1-like esterase